MLHQFLYYKDIQGISWDVAHLYEHYFIGAFYDLVEQYGIAKGVAGYMDGDTFEEAIFLDVGLYDRKVVELFREFLHTPLYFSQENIQHYLKGIECEERALISINDERALLSQLQTLSNQSWVEVVDVEQAAVSRTADINHPLDLKKSAKSFRDITVVTYIESDDLAERTLFLRLSVILSDILSHTLSDKFGAYNLANSSTRANLQSHNIGFMTKLRFARGITLNDIEAVSMKAFAGFPLDQNMPFIQAHFTTFARHEPWKRLAIEYFENTRIIASNEHIASLATKDRIHSILSKIKIKAGIANRADEHHFE